MHSLSKLVLIVLCISPVLCAMNADDWNTFGFNDQRNSYSNVFIPTHADGPSYQVISAADGPITGSISIRDDNLIYGSGDGYIHKVDSKTFAHTKSAKSYGQIDTSAPAIDANGNGFIGTTQGLVYFKTSDLSEIWVVPGSVKMSPIVDTTGNVYCGFGDDGTMRSYDSSKTLRWQVDSGRTGDWTASPALSEDFSVLFASFGVSRVAALSTTDGSLKWNFTGPATNPEFCTPTVSYNGIVYVGTESGFIHALNANTGSLLWDAPLNAAVDRVQHMAIMSPSNQLWIPAMSQLIVFSTVTHTEEYRFDVSSEGYATNSPAISSNNDVYVTSQDGVFLVATSDLTVRQRIALSFKSKSSPVLHNNAIYVGTDQDSIIILSPCNCNGYGSCLINQAGTKCLCNAGYAGDTCYECDSPKYTGTWPNCVTPSPFPPKSLSAGAQVAIAAVVIAAVGSLGYFIVSYYKKHKAREYALLASSASGNNMSFYKSVPIGP